MFCLANVDPVTGKPLAVTKTADLTWSNGAGRWVVYPWAKVRSDVTYDFETGEWIDGSQT